MLTLRHPLIFYLFADLVISLILTGCAAPATETPLISDKEKAIYQSYLDQKKKDYYCDKIIKVSRVGYKILEKLPSEERLKDIPILPFILLESKVYFDYFSTGTASDHTLTVLGIVPEWLVSPSVVERGDTLVAINGEDIHNLGDFKKMQKKLGHAQKVEVTFRRQGETWNETVPLHYGGYGVLFLVDPQISQVNAYFSPFGYIAVTTAMLRFLENDDELAFVLSHEIAHGIKGHIKTQVANQMLGVLVGNLAAVFLNQYAAGSGQPGGFLAASAVMAPFSREMETQADEFGMRYMTAAGYDPKGALTCLRRMAVEAQDSQNFAFLQSHPMCTDRLSHMEEIIAQFAKTQNKNL